MATHLSLYVHAATSGRHFIGATIFPTNGVIGTNQISGVPNAAVVTETFSWFSKPTDTTFFSSFLLAG